jgi:NAD(P)-dependent dehydrogenase (short-subunit alcohol dehydrogenase family)
MRTAVVTGGASGIGRALAAALVRRGVHVTIADIDADRAEQVAGELAGGAGGPRGSERPGGADGPGARGTAVAVRLDVTDAGAVAEVMRSVKDEHGQLDLVFNNAGIGVGGTTDEFTLDHWNRTIDVNLRGVVHGVHAAYPIMLQQRSGHIVNTASVAGLMPVPFMAPYTTTKHAVVGLSLGLRAEAAGSGVRVSAVCPGFTDTPMIDTINPGLPQTEIGKSTREIAIRLVRRLYNVEALAEDILRGVARNRALIVAPASARLAWRAARLSPSMVARAAGAQVGRLRRETAAGG